jgi:hypothetical protein
VTPGALPATLSLLTLLKPAVIMADAASPIKADRSAAPGMPIVGATIPIEQRLIASSWRLCDRHGLQRRGHKWEAA